MRDFQSGSDSTELLLDAMCNIFGVVLITAIAIGGVTISQKFSDPGKISKQSMQELQSKSSLQATQLAAARSQREILQELAKNIPVNTPEDSGKQLLDQQYRQLLDRVNTLADRIEAADRQLAQAQAVEERLNNSSEEKERLLIARYREALEQKSGQAVQTFGKVRANSLKPWRILVDKEKFYTIGSNQDIYRGSTNDSAVEIKSFKQGKVRCFHITKRPEKGRSLQEFSCERVLPPAEKMDEYFVEVLSESDAVASGAFIIGKLRKKKLYIAWKTVSGKGAVLRTAEQGIYEVSR
ncbi:MAG: hypothetical protein IKD10_08120 [Lentisphaeria bacterium]|nr:hypothetical protein [Lentisphaerota bacterium]MBR7144893.1 hypothetical protein [Lentisphaeria bacterium]